MAMSTRARPTAGGPRKKGRYKRQTTRSNPAAHRQELVREAVADSFTAALRDFSKIFRRGVGGFVTPPTSAPPFLGRAPEAVFTRGQMASLPVLAGHLRGPNR